MPIDSVFLEKIERNDPTLTRLDLNRKHDLTAEDVRQLAKALMTNASLTRLDLSNSPIGKESARFLLGDNTTLIRLLLGNTGLEAEDAKILANNTTLIGLSIGNNEIGDEGAIALASHKSLMRLGMRNNGIGDEGAKALARNNRLTMLEISNNQITDEGVKALANSISLTELYVRYNQITDEGAEALAKNTILTELEVYGNNISSHWRKELEQTIKRNKQQVVKRRDQFIRAIITLARDQNNPNSASDWAKLPRDMQLTILSLINFTSEESIGKSAKQIYQCAKFILDNVAAMNQSLDTAIKTGQDFKVMEKIDDETSRFRFFP